MTLHPGMWVHKIPSKRDAQIAGLNHTHVWLTWMDTGQQTVVQQARLNRTNEWKVATR